MFYVERNIIQHIAIAIYLFVYCTWSNSNAFSKGLCVTNMS